MKWSAVAPPPPPDFQWVVEVCLPRTDIEDLMSSEESLHITCDYCSKVYEIPPSALAGLLSTS